MTLGERGLILFILILILFFFVYFLSGCLCFTCTLNRLLTNQANFKPPPQVESAVVRITPKTGSEKPKFNFAEMDGMLRVSLVSPACYWAIT